MGTERRDVYRDRYLWLVVEICLVQAVILPLERDELLRPEEPYDDRRLPQPPDPLRVRAGPLVPEGYLVQPLSGRHAEPDPPGSQVGEGGERLGHYPGIVSEERRRDARARHEPVAPCGHRGHHLPRKAAVSPGVEPGMEVVRDPEGVKAGLMSAETAFDQVQRGVLFGRRVQSYEKRSHGWRIVANASSSIFKPANPPPFSLDLGECKPGGLTPVRNYVNLIFVSDRITPSKPHHAEHRQLETVGCGAKFLYVGQTIPKIDYNNFLS